MSASRAYQPLWPAPRPGGRPTEAPVYRVLVHQKYFDRWLELPERVGLEAAQEFWDHVACLPGQKPALAPTTILRGSAGLPKGPGFSRTIHYEVSSKARINYQYCDTYRTTLDGDPHRVVAILTIDYSSH